MTQPQVEPTHDLPAMTALHETLDEAISALASFDVERLESLKSRAEAMTLEPIARELADGGEAVSELLRKHTVLGDILNATAANLKVISAVMAAKHSGIANGSQDRSNPAPWLP